MHEDNKSCLSNTRIIARAFIERHYPDEAPLFDIFWETFTSRMQLFHSQFPGVWPAPNTAHDIIAEVSFAAGGALDFVTPITLATLSATLHKIDIENLSSAELEKLICQSAARYGAKPGLTAALVRHISALCKELLTAKTDADEAVVFTASESKYEIWTDGEIRIVDSIDKYKKNKSKYLLWIDLDEKSKTPKKFPDPRAIELLKYLVKNIGYRNPVEDVLRCVFEATMGVSPDHAKNRIDQQITQLNNHSNKQFRRYLFRNWFTDGLGLESSFKDKYLLFSRLKNQ